jgi:hypothetical protein
MMLEFVALFPLLAGWLGCFWLVRELSARGRIHSDWRVSWAAASVLWGNCCSWWKQNQIAAVKTVIRKKFGKNTS